MPELQSELPVLFIIGMILMAFLSTIIYYSKNLFLGQIYENQTLFFSKNFSKFDNKNSWKIFFIFGTLTMAFCLIGNLNFLNYILTNLFLIFAILLNFLCWDLSMRKSTKLKSIFYYKWISFFGGIFSFAIMFAISFIFLFVTIIVGLLIMACFHYCQPKNDFNGRNYQKIEKNILKKFRILSKIENNIENLQPQILLMIGNPGSRLPLLDFANNITKGENVLIAAHVIQVSSVCKLGFLLPKNQAETCILMQKLSIFC